MDNYKITNVHIRTVNGVRVKSFTAYKLIHGIFQFWGNFNADFYTPMNELWKVADAKNS